MNLTSVKGADMIIPSFDGSELELTLSGHRWPYLEGGHQVLFWLKVGIRVFAPFGSVMLRESCLLDWEAEKLIHWLEAVAQGEPVDPAMKFIEGTLAFEILSSQDNEVTLRCHLMSLLERWSLHPAIDRAELMPEYDLFQEVDLMLSRNQLARSAHELKQEFEKLPINMSK
jgi:hypothetical protein